MKIKPVYIYLIVFVAFIVAVIVFSNYNDSESSTNNMPKDEVHQGLSNEGDMPSKSNVRSTAMEQLESLKAVYEKNPKDTLAAREYADMLTMAHQYEKAIDIYNYIISVDPKRIDAHLQLTYVHFNNGDFTKAYEHTNKILAINKDHQIALYNSGAIEAAKGNNSKAKEIWQSLLKQFPKTDIAHIAEQSLIQLEASSKQK
jgi:tetratricopeptide (TPR) repeat protein